MGNKNTMEMLNTKYGITESMIRTARDNGLALYYDMDNTTCLWCEKDEDSRALERVYEEGYFLNLPPIDNIEQTIKALIEVGLDVHIISACVESPYCKPEKRLWVARYLPWIKEENIHLCAMGEDKSRYVTGNIANAILIDDYKNNLNAFQRAGGMVVKKSYSGKPRPIPFVKNHMDIFYIIKEVAQRMAA